MCNVKHEISLREHDQDFLPIYEITNNITIYIPSTILTENDKTAFSINQNIVQVQNVCLFNSSIFMEYMPDTTVVLKHSPTFPGIHPSQHGLLKT